MHRRKKALAQLILALSVAACAEPGPTATGELRRFPPELQPGAAQGLNVLLITLDTTRADRLGSYGHAGGLTPNLDALGQHGVRFEDAVTVVPVTLPSHATMLTGLYPPNHGVRDNGEFRLAPEHTTLAELLAERGYQTAAFVAAFVLDDRYGLGQGFETYDDLIVHDKGGDWIDRRTAAEVTDNALRWLRGRDAERPFFAWVHYFDPHHPHELPELYKIRFGENTYDAEIAYMDAEIGRLLEGIDAEKTLVVVVADHGESLGEHDEDTHGVLIYESTMRVPLIFSSPALFGGAYVVDEVTAATVDIFPTVLGLLGFDAGDNDGIALFDAAGLAGRRIYMESLLPHLSYGWAALYGLRRHQDKMILAPRPEYYDLLQDPHETGDRYANPSVEGARARDSLEADLAEMLADWPGAAGVAESMMPLDPKTRSRLESLGYVGSLAGGADDGAALDPKDMMATLRDVLAAAQLGRKGRHAEALALLDGAMAASVPSRAILDQAAKMYLILNRIDEAQTALRRSIEIRPTPTALRLLAQTMYTSGRYEEVDPLIDQAIALDPQDGAALVVRGDVAAQLGRYEDAQAAYLRAREVDEARAGPAVARRLPILRKMMAERASR